MCMRQDAEVDAVAAEVADMLRKKGEGGQPGQSAGTLLALLANAQASLAEEGQHVQQQAPAAGSSASAPGAAMPSGSDALNATPEGGSARARSHCLQQSRAGAWRRQHWCRRP